MKTLQKLADEAVDEILTAPVNGPRAGLYRQTVGNRKTRVVRGIRNRFKKEVAKMGFESKWSDYFWQQVIDLAELSLNAEAVEGGAL